MNGIPSRRDLAGGLLRLYPGAWRDRYGGEMRETLGEHHITTFTLIDLALGALDARRHPELVPLELFSTVGRISRDTAQKDDDMTRAQNLGSIFLAVGSLIAIALSIEFAYDEADPVNLLWGVFLGVVPLLIMGWAMRSRSTTLLEIAAWACSAILFALVVRARPGGDLLVLIEAVYLAGALLLTWPRARHLRATRI